MNGGFIQLGKMKVWPLVTSRFSLDGGSMFGTVPRVLWERKAPPDDRNRIVLNINTLVVETEGRLVVIEAGMGSKFDERWQDLYALGDVDLEGGLESLGIAPGDVDTVVLTHLHLDHAGGATVLDEAGVVSPAFPRAAYVVQEEEWKAAVDPHPLARPSYLPDDFLPLERSGRLEVVAGEREVAPGVRVEPAPGHTAGHQVVRLRSQGEEALYLGDLVPTTAYLKLNWLMSWDLEPLVMYGEKARLLEDAARRGVLLFWSHDPEIACGRIARSGETEYTLEDSSVMRVDGPRGE